jgi:hypothetical protein
MVRMIPRVIPRMIQVVNQEYSLLVRFAVSAVVIIPAHRVGSQRWPRGRWSAQRTLRIAA